METTHDSVLDWPEYFDWTQDSGKLHATMRKKFNSVKMVLIVSYCSTGRILSRGTCDSDSLSA